MNNEETISKITPPPEIPTMEPIMTIGLIKKKKGQMERDILTLIDEFTEETQCRVNRIDFATCQDSEGNTIIVRVRAKVKI